VEDYQVIFPESIRQFAGAQVRNFITYRISGMEPGAIAAFSYPGRATDYDADVLQGLAVVIGSLVTLSNEVRETEKAFVYTIEALARACEAAEEQTGRHILRVNRYAGALAANMGLSGEFVDTVSFSAQMHDVGKIKIPVAILLKEGALSQKEMELMRMHPVYGEQILGDSPRLAIAREVAIAHHENWDGSGYPYGLKGVEIPLAGRITKIADVYDALRSRRSYKDPASHEETLRVFRDGDGRVRPREHFDPELLATFFKVEGMFAGIYESLSESGG
jgi:response regulator RpfG family c-di-GMP phosphodiesterase